MNYKEALELQNMFITAAQLAKSANQYEYNEANDTYKSNEPITYSTNVESYEANIIAENVVVKFDHNSIQIQYCQLLEPIGQLPQRQHSFQNNILHQSGKQK